MASFLGICLSIVIFLSAIYIGTGGNYHVFINLPSVAIVMGGTLAATFICFPFKDVLKVAQSILVVFAREGYRFQDYINEITTLAKEVREVRNYDAVDVTAIKDGFLKEALQMLKDGIHSSQDIFEILNARIEFIHNRETAQANILLTMGKLAPAFGMIGTLIGLIDMLQKMGKELDAIGSGMAVALVTTFYGLMLSNLVFIPFAEKKKRRTEEDIIFKRMIAEGIVLLNEFQHPFVVEDRLNSYLPLKKRRDSIAMESFKITLQKNGDPDPGPVDNKGKKEGKMKKDAAKG